MECSGISVRLPLELLDGLRRNRWTDSPECATSVRYRLSLQTWGLLGTPNKEGPAQGPGPPSWDCTVQLEIIFQSRPERPARTGLRPCCPSRRRQRYAQCTHPCFVDAGYLFAAAGALCFGTSHRRDLNLDPDKATLFLRERCSSHCDQVHLRTYWYDGAPDAVPTDDQVRVGEEQGVKLRLGRLTRHGQKGVDPHIVRDLIVLSRNGAMSTAYLMSGDEDERKGVIEAQEFGVAVIVLGIEPSVGRTNQAATLIREADDLHHVVAHRLQKIHYAKHYQRTQTINALRGHLAEFGLVAPLGTHNVGRLEEAYAECEEFFPVLVPPAIRRLIERIHELDADIDETDRENRRVREDETLRRLMTIPGVGELMAMAVHTYAPPMESFRTGRDFAAWVGLTPCESSTGGRQLRIPTMPISDFGACRSPCRSGGPCCGPPWSSRTAFSSIRP